MRRMNHGKRALALIWLTFGGLGCDSLPGGKEAITKAAVKSCAASAAARREEVPLDCECLVRQAVSDMTPEEVRLWANTPDLFDEAEVQVLLTRRAMSCLKPQLISTCVGKGGPLSQCTCIAEGVLESFTGDELLDLSERLRNGSAVNPEAARIRLDCAARFPRRVGG